MPKREGSKEKGTTNAEFLTRATAAIALAQKFRAVRGRQPHGY